MTMVPVRMTSMMPNRLYEAQEGLDLVLVAGDLDDQVVGGDARDLGVENLDDLDDLRARLAGGPDLDEGELAGYHVVTGHL